MAGRVDRGQDNRDGLVHDEPAQVGVDDEVAVEIVNHLVGSADLVEDVLVGVDDQGVRPLDARSSVHRERHCDVGTMVGAVSGGDGQLVCAGSQVLGRQLDRQLGVALTGLGRLGVILGSFLVDGLLGSGSLGGDLLGLSSRGGGRSAGRRSGGSLGGRGRRRGGGAGVVRLTLEGNLGAFGGDHLRGLEGDLLAVQGHLHVAKVSVRSLDGDRRRLGHHVTSFDSGNLDVRSLGVADHRDDLLQAVAHEVVETQQDAVAVRGGDILRESALVDLGARIPDVGEVADDVAVDGQVVTEGVVPHPAGEGDVLRRLGDVDGTILGDTRTIQLDAGHPAVVEHSPCTLKDLGVLGGVGDGVADLRQALVDRHLDGEVQLGIELNLLALDREGLRSTVEGTRDRVGARVRLGVDVGILTVQEDVLLAERGVRISHGRVVEGDAQGVVLGDRAVERQGDGGDVHSVIGSHDDLGG